MSSGPSLIDSITETLKRAATTSLDISFNELLDMHENGELDITPDYQRLFRWSEGQRSRFIESLLLEMPVPPIYVIEEDEGRYLLIDGLQRISSYLHLRGKLTATHLEPEIVPGNMLVLTDCDIVPALNGQTFETLPTALQIRLKRAFIRVEVVRKGTDPLFKYFMFKRLNTGGELLSAQQVRNCTIRMLDSKFPDFIITMSTIEEFTQCTRFLTDERTLSAFDQELVLRFFALKNRREKFQHEVTDFLTEYMEDVADPKKAEQFNYASEEATFRKTFRTLQCTLGDLSFGRANPAGTGLNRSFSIYHYEAITIGLQVVVEKLDLLNPSVVTKVKEELTRIKLDREFIKITTGGGKNSPGPLKERIEFVQSRLANAFDR